MKEKIELQRERDFSENISTLFLIVRTQFKRLFGSVVFIAGPIVLIVSILLAYVSIQNMNMVMGVNPNSEGFIGTLLTTYSIALLGYVGLWFCRDIVGTVIFSYLKI